MLRWVVVLIAASAACCSFAGDVAAQTYPQRTVKFILPFGPGSGADITMRMFSDKLATRWGKPVVIENRPGGDGLVAINAFISANDEHTLLYVPGGTFAVHPFTHEKLTYDADRDLIPVANVSTLVLAAASPASLKANTLREFVEFARAEPNRHNAAAAPGNADFLLSGFLKTENLEVAKVPYRDIMQGPGDLSENRLQLLMSSLAIVMPLRQAGRVKVLAVTSRKRAPIAPDIPTVAEAGFPSMTLESISGVFAPRGMSAETREKIAADFRAVAESDPTIAQRLETTGQVLDIQGPQQFTASIKELRDKLAGIAKLVGMKPTQ
jgi:tripartite-type tricarboxylate transporter receptor subunit TctC